MKELLELFGEEMGSEINEWVMEIIKEIGEKIGTIQPIYFSKYDVGGYGILFGNTTGMILAYILLAVVGIFTLIGVFVTLKALIKLILFGRKKKMTPEEQWLKTGKF